MALLLRLILLLPLFWLAGCQSIYFLPMKPWAQNPANQGLAYEDVVLLHPRGMRIHGWWLPAQGRSRGTVYYLHGNAQNISTHLMNVAWLPAQGFDVFLVDYRGYGLSEGKPDIEGAQRDIQLGLDWLRASGRLGERPLIVFGQSLGASLAMPVLAQESNHGRYDCVIAEAAFSSYRGVVNDVMKRSWLLWSLRPLVVPFQPRRYDPQDSIAGIRAPLLLLHSEEDEVIPYAHGEALYQAAGPQREFQRLRGAHIASLRDPAVRGRLVTFMEDRCGARLAAPAREPVVTPPPASGRERQRPPVNGFSF